MARPERHDCDYFPFLAKDGRTLHILEGKYQCKGTGFFTNVMRFLTLQEDHHFCIADEADRLYFFSKCKCDDVSGIDMLNIMAKTRKIHTHLWVSSSVIVSEDLLKSLEAAYLKRKNDIITIEEIASFYGVNMVSSNNNSQTSVVSSSENPQVGDVSGSDNPQRIGKDRILKKRKENKIPNCPIQKIIESYHFILSELPKVKSINSIKKYISARWKEDCQRQVIEWWEYFFADDIAMSDFLMGRIEDKDFKASLGWIVKPENFDKILNGQYLNRRREKVDGYTRFLQRHQNSK